MPSAAAAGVIAAVGATGAYATAITVVTYAVVGAAIGALTSAVMGGDIGKGSLWGGIGGAVAGGFSVAAGTASEAVSSGSAALSGSGSTAGMGVADAYTAAGEQFMQTAANNTGYSWAGSGASAGFEASASAGGLGAQTALNMVSGGIKGYMESESAKDALEANREDARESRAWQSAEAEKQRAHELQAIAARGASGGGGSDTLRTAMENNRAAMERQKDQQGYEKAMWGLNREAKTEDQKKFGESVVAGAQAQYDAKVGQIENFMAAPSWLQPRTQAMSADGGVAQPQQQAQDVQATQPQYTASILPQPTQGTQQSGAFQQGTTQGTING